MKEEKTEKAHKQQKKSNKIVLELLHQRKPNMAVCKLYQVIASITKTHFI